MLVSSSAFSSVWIQVSLTSWISWNYCKHWINQAWDYWNNSSDNCKHNLPPLHTVRHPHHHFQRPHWKHLLYALISSSHLVSISSFCSILHIWAILEACDDLSGGQKRITCPWRVFSSQLDEAHAWLHTSPGTFKKRTAKSYPATKNIQSLWTPSSPWTR